MSNPKFSVGDRVAVCSANLDCIIPDTVVIASELDADGFFFCPRTLETYFEPGGWSYLVQGEQSWIPEPALRPINPDDYSITEDEKELSL